VTIVAVRPMAFGLRSRPGERHLLGRGAVRVGQHQGGRPLARARGPKRHPDRAAGVRGISRVLDATFTSVSIRWRRRMTVLP
jgi:hypothetical protein